MKFHANFILKHSTLPIDYRRCILSFIKHCLTSANDGKYFDTYYTPGKTKDFCFSTHFEHPVFSSEKIEVESKKMSITISTPNVRTGFIFLSAFTAQKGKSYPLPFQNHMTLLNLNQMKEDNIIGNRILVKMQEPLCIRSHNSETNKDWYYSCKSPDSFVEQSKRIITCELQQAGFPEEYCNVSLLPINAKSIVVKHYNINIECSIGDFELIGNSSALDYLLKVGIGSKRSSGFGVAKLLAQEV